MKTQNLCRVCESGCDLLFEARIMNKYDITYYKCSNCGFIQTEQPYWLEEAYKHVIAKTDTGLLKRNLLFRDIVAKLIVDHFNPDARYLDYAGGYGTFTRLMRDMGFDFYTHDKYCKNIFAADYEIKEIQAQDKFEMITAFEYLEHITDPIEEVKRLFQHSDALLFSTELQEAEDYKSIDDWWYFAPETGQHISFYTLDSLDQIAKKLDCDLFTNRTTLHLFVKKSLNITKDPFRLRRKSVIHKVFRKLASITDNSDYKKTGSRQN
jgi:hypothetical protein